MDVAATDLTTWEDVAEGIGMLAALLGEVGPKP